MRRIVHMGVLSVLLLLLPPASVVTAGAQIPQCGVRSNYFDGMARFGAWYMGSQAYIKTRWGFVCDTDTDPISNFTNSWSMIASGAFNGWAQSGFERGYGGSLRFFAQQYNGATGSLQTVYGGLTQAGEVHRYWQQTLNDCPGLAWCIHSNIDLTRFLTSTFNPFTYWVQPFSQQFFGETAYRESDMPGRSSSRTSFSDIQVQDYWGNWAPIPSPFLTGYVDSTRWGLQPTSSTSFDIWTH